MDFDVFVEKYGPELELFWNSIKSDVRKWKQAYEWPRNVKLDEALKIRNELEKAIIHDYARAGYLTKNTFDKVILWGFGKRSGNTDQEITAQTRKAFMSLKENKIADAAFELTMLEGIGISRASKILALSDQHNFGIYDSRSAHGLSDLCCEGKRLIPIPPGRVVKGDTLPPWEFCLAFQLYNWALRYFRQLVQKDSALNGTFPRVADLEIAFFARSRGGFDLEGQSIIIKAETSLKYVSESETDAYYTLGAGRKAKQFWAFIDENGLYILTGPEGRTQFLINHKQIEKCLSHFSGIGWFPLGNAVDNLKAGGLGEYFRDIFKTSPKFASHFASMMVEQGRLAYHYGRNNMVELKVNDYGELQ